MQINPRVVLLLTCLANLTFVPLAWAQAGDVAVIVNRNNPITDLSYQELRKIFNGETRSWSTGVPIKLFVRDPGARERIVLLNLLGMTEHDYKLYWVTEVFRGRAQASPVTLFSNNVQRQAVQVYPGAVALVDARDVKSGTKVVTVEGRMPGEDKYPLR
jgi:ABC-type phosphate transport system substrate-binding protein